MPRLPTTPSPEPQTALDRAATATALARAHWNVAVPILSINGGLYLVLILLIAYDKRLLGQTVIPGLSLGIVFGAFVTIAAWLLTLIYVRWANASDHAPGAN